MSTRRIITVVTLICALLLITLSGDNSSADSGDLSNAFFRIGLHHGSGVLPGVKVSYTGRVQFFTPDISGDKNVLLEDDGTMWQVQREAIRLEVGPYSSQPQAEQILATWPQNIGPAYIVREPQGIFVVGGLFATVEQAWLNIPQLNAVGISTAQVRGTMSLVTVQTLSFGEAAALRDRLVAGEVRARLYFDGTWRVAVGTATDIAGLATLRDKLTQATPEFAWDNLSPDFRRLYVVRQDGTQLFSYANLTQRPLRVEAVSGLDTAMAIENTRHRGTFEFNLNQDNKFIVLSIMHIDDYIKAVVPREMSSAWPIEALKAQAVVARTYAYVNRGKHAAEGFDICTHSTHCQAYGGVHCETESTNRAVDETKGTVLFYNGRPALAYYYSDSGGHTENVEHVWSSPIPYLVGIPDPYGVSAGSTQASWQIELTQQELQNIVKHNGGDAGTILSLRVSDKYPSGRIKELLIHGTSGNVTYTKQQPRMFNGTSALFALKSTMYTVDIKAVPVVAASAQGKVTLPSVQNAYVATASGVQQLPVAAQFSLRSQSGLSTISAVPTSFVFNGSGWGHGVGMSQWGAKGMAELGHSHTEILLHYYRDIQIVTVGQ